MEALEVPWSKVPDHLKEWIAANPGQTLFIVASGVLTVFPGLLTGPVYSLLGFTPLGPQAGSLAASIQSSIGNVASRSLFAHLQSAAMSGYGGATVNAAVRLAASGGYLTARVAGRFLRW